MRRWLSLWLLLSSVVIVVALLCEEVLQLPLAQTVHSLLTEPGVSAALIIVLLLSLDLFLPVPSSLVMFLNGTLFGIVGGSVLSLLGVFMGNTLGFELTRRYGMGLARRLVGEKDLYNMHQVFTRYGVLAILLSRPVPIMMETLSVLAGLSTMPRRTFILANLLGTLPVCFLYAYAGTSAQQLQSLVPAGLIGLGLPAVGWLIAQRWRRASTRRTALEPVPTPQRHDPQ